jgi:tetraacyldisaccharide 4'-kinase
LKALSGLYGRFARARRAWYTRHPGRRRHLNQPVISVGNLVVGGSGKTPVVAALARLLSKEGERPAILTRGYARRRGGDGVVVVSDPDRVLEPTDRSGDEPQMLARMLPGVPVLVSANRHLAGLLAERRFGCTVHLLDDGFQHVQLAREMDLLLLAASDIDDRVLPAGRLREPIEAAAGAHAWLVSGGQEDVELVSARLGRKAAFRLVPRYDTLRSLDPFGAALPGSAVRVVAVAGIARPRRFFGALRDQGFEVVREIACGDHHQFSSGDIDAIQKAARQADADAIVTTEKDAMRLVDLPAGLLAHSWAFLPMEVGIEPPDLFTCWLHERLAAARGPNGVGGHSST